MLKSIVDYVKYHYQFYENIESSFLSNNLDTVNGLNPGVSVVRVV